MQTHTDHADVLIESSSSSPSPFPSSSSSSSLGRWERLGLGFRGRGREAPGREPRAGVALLIVLGLIALLMITGVAFTILMRIERAKARLRPGKGERLSPVRFLGRLRYPAR